MPIYKILLTILLASFFAFPQSVIRITGKVIAIDSIPVSGVVIELKKVGIRDTTDSSGTFLLVDTIQQSSVLKRKFNIFVCLLFFLQELFFVYFD
jgi:hypothetical protein